jgi:hypothetical protein
VNELETLRTLTLAELRKVYRDVAGEDCPRSYTRDELVELIAEPMPRDVNVPK